MTSSIFVVDDSATNRLELEILLKSLSGLSVRSFEEPGECLRAVRSQSVDLIVSDFRMPRTDGVLLLAEIRVLRPEAEVIVVTSYGTVESAVSALRLGAYDYIVRDSSYKWKSSLLDSVSEALEARPSKREPGLSRERVLRHFLVRLLHFQKGAKVNNFEYAPGLACEYAVKLLLESCGFADVLHRQSSKTEEIDLVCLNVLQDPFWEKLGPMLLVECKDRKVEKASAEERTRFEEKIRRRGGQATVGIFVSTSGFSSTFYDRSGVAPVAGGGIPLVVAIDSEALSEWFQATNRLKWLTIKTAAAIIQST